MKAYLTFFIGVLCLLATSTGFGAGTTCASLFSFEDISKNSFYKITNLRAQWKYLSPLTNSEGAPGHEIYLSRPFKVNTNQTSKEIVAQLGGDKLLLYDLRAIEKFEKFVEHKVYLSPLNKIETRPNSQANSIEDVNGFGTIASKIFLGLIEKEIQSVILYRTNKSYPDQEVYLYTLLIIEPSGWAYEFSIRASP